MPTRTPSSRAAEAVSAGLDAAACERARQTRDPRFDGRFFVGVRTTGVYCRPVCPVRPPKPENVRFFASAAAAAEAGFRPCLRCRPESAPGTSAWRGTEATVSRALRLIQGGALDEGSVDALAGRLGIGARHLGRLFLSHVGATPGRVAQTRRLQLAKKLLDETDLPVGEVALAAGFGSVRRFHEVLRATYGRTPQALRRGRREAPAEGALRLRLSFRPPFDWPALREFLALRAVPGVERVAGDRYERTIALDGRAGALAVRPLADRRHLELALRFPDVAPVLVRITARVRRLFDLDADPATLERDLARDPGLAPAVRARPGVRVPGAFDGFELAVRAILGQGVSVRGARTLAGRLAARYGRPLEAPPDAELRLCFPTPEALAGAELEGLGVLPARAAAIRRLAALVSRGALDLETPRDLGGFVGEISRLQGVAAWTAHYVALRALGDPDAFPASDLGLLRGAERCLAEGRALTPAALERRAESWRPWRGYAAMHLWLAYGAARAGAGTGPPFARTARGTSRPQA
jgi:AraC family transcriptional regulator of adaptative response / DNA-3-methyladenine glycosylase II